MEKDLRKILVAKMVEALPLLRKSYDISQKGLAEYLGITRNTIINIENKKTPLCYSEFVSLYVLFSSNENCKKILDAFEINFDGNKTIPNVSNIFKTRERNHLEITKSLSEVLSRYKILLLNNDPNILKQNKLFLENEGATVEAVSTTQSAIEKIEQGNGYDILIFDEVADAITGQEIAMFVRSLGKETPIVILSNEITSDKENSGAYNYIIHTPIVSEEFFRLIILISYNELLNFKKELEITIKDSLTDVLTGVGNIKAYADKIANLNLKIINNESPEFGFVMCDINNLKEENDKHGHGIGDIYIVNCVNILSSIFSYDSIYRTGGDEFIIIFENDDYQNIDELISFLKEKLEVSTLIKDSESGKASIAYGVAKFDPVNDYSLSDTLKRADIAMYKNKNECKKLLKRARTQN